MDNALKSNLGGFISLGVILLSARFIAGYYKISLLDPVYFIPLFFTSVAIPIGVAISLDDKNAEYGENKIHEIKSNEFDYSKLGANN